MTAVLSSAYSLPLSILRRALALFLIVNAFSGTVLAQEEWGSGYGVEVNLLGGRMLKHTEKMGAALPEAVGGVELNLLQQTRGQKAWHAARGYPQVGVGIAYTHYGLADVYGQCIAAYPNLQLPLLRHKHFEWTLRGGYGVGYVTRRYDRAGGDTLNRAIGSHLNNFSLFSTDLRYRPSKHWDIQAGFHFTHLSNAAARRPNLGLNVAGVHVGVRYFPVTSQPERSPVTAAQSPNRWWGAARFGVAMQEEGPPDGPLFPVYLTSIYGGRRWRETNKVFIGVDASYHGFVEAFLKNNEINMGTEGRYAWKSAVFGGNEFLFGRTAVLVQFGVYVREAYLRLDPFYQKVGIQYYVRQREKGMLKDVFFAALLKTHKAQAELAEFGLGVGF